MEQQTGNDWSNLNQDEKYEIIRDYVRRGFDNLDAIMDDYNKNADAVGVTTFNKIPPRSALEEVLNEWYGRTEWPGGPDPDIDL